MSVIVISCQMLADAVKKAESFRTSGFPTEEKMMCHKLGKMNSLDAKRNTYEVRAFFFRLLRWNKRSYELRYQEEKWESEYEIAEFFNIAMNLQPKEISILQFEQILRFLSYNIENYEFSSKYPFKEQMDEDVALLKEIIHSLDYGILNALKEKEGVKWCY